MRLATLVTNTDDSDFAHARDMDDVKFAKLIHLVRPDWEVGAFDVTKGEFPDDLAPFDGVMITGSPASVHDDAPWVTRLEELIRQMVGQGVPVFGACFGHQVIAKALGGTVGYNPGGWVMGRIETRVVDRAPWMDGAPDTLGLYAAHKEQVLEPPAGVRILSETPGCPVGGFAVGAHVYTTQYHPEIDPDFMADLLDELAGDLPAAVVKEGKESLANVPDKKDFAETIARFFEQARA
ncbi:type 1 glutamine amidotransferase [Lutimaribacter sp. EGI FJ00015]|uniref:Type 1 glutamine amidotransferase n=1 Tax=Lutimaribacter degradans TaxID=2945989 RepID=A0ACC5ZXM5_9RHOB|nr:type 1 glutamine amidotransferase [Lutimaribacter sp. EGI FJ00013]MCM2563123.1 type 1 glutamine amidotransferase [Lutimaribacter sp. EGI FJ00013]MCO0614302.1 type 1 glutamine amidotransferase [Lutimaribacter sp. EGI FJ00015]MCO0637112.1 type 1 glutamine amidotransferase [Lutimaribacter sp. EGI FJ00014]